MIPEHQLARIEIANLVFTETRRVKTARIGDWLKALKSKIVRNNANYSKVMIMLSKIGLIINEPNLSFKDCCSKCDSARIIDFFIAKFRYKKIKIRFFNNFTRPKYF